MSLESSIRYKEYIQLSKLEQKIIKNYYYQHEQMNEINKSFVLILHLPNNISAENFFDGSGVFSKQSILGVVDIELTSFESFVFCNNTNLSSTSPSV